MKEKRRMMMVVVLGLMTVMVVMEMRMVNGIEVTPRPSQCKEERRLAVKSCRPFVFGKSASRECCRQVKVSHLECVCSIFTPKMAALIDANRAMKLFRDCGRKVPRQFKCGSLDFP